jgi:hypothetical protein
MAAKTLAELPMTPKTSAAVRAVKVLRENLLEQEQVQILKNICRKVTLELEEMHNSEEVNIENICDMVKFYWPLSFWLAYKCDDSQHTKLLDDMVIRVEQHWGLEPCTIKSMMLTVWLFMKKENLLCFLPPGVSGFQEKKIIF